MEICCGLPNSKILAKRKPGIRFLILAWLGDQSPAHTLSHQNRLRVKPRNKHFVKFLLLDSNYLTLEYPKSLGAALAGSGQEVRELLMLEVARYVEVKFERGIPESSLAEIHLILLIA